MPYTFDPIFAVDPGNPANVAANAVVTIFAPGDTSLTPLTLTTPDGLPFENPVTTSSSGHAGAFVHETLGRVAWSGGGFTGFFTAYDDIKQEAVAARDAAQLAAENAAAELSARIAAGEFQGEPGRDGSNVVPTAQAIATEISTEGTPANTALNATTSEALSPVEVAHSARIATDRKGQSDRQSAQGSARIAWEDSTSYQEGWADLAGWTVPASSVQVSGGKLYAAASSTGSGISRGINISKGFRAKGTITNVPGGTTGSALIGVSRTAPGAAWVAGDRMGVGFGANGDMIGYEGTNLPGGTGSTVLVSNAPAGTYGWAIDIDDQNISITITTPSGVTYRRRRLLSNIGAGTIQTLVINNNDGRGTTGLSVSGFGYRESHASLKPAALETTGFRAETMGFQAASQQFRLILPNRYDSRRPLPFIISAHGNTQTEEHLTLSPERRALVDAILAAGYGYASHLMHGNNWGSPDAVTDIKNLYLKLKAQFPLGPVVLLGESMGGLASWTTLARQEVPLAGLGILDGVANLRWHWDNGADGTGTTDRSRIISAYGMAADGSDYANKAAGYDPALQPAEVFAGVPIHITVADNETRVIPELNGELMFDKISGHGNVELSTHTGGHTDPTAFDTARWIPFFARCIGTS